MYHIIRQNRKTIALTINEALEVCVKAPHFVSEEEIEKIVTKNKEWIQKAQQEKKKRCEAVDWIQKQEILYLGETRKIYFRESKKSKGCIEFINNSYYITLSQKDNEASIKELMETYRKQQAQPLFEALTYKYCKHLGVTCGKVTIRKQKTRWGSCSSKGNIAYNVKLLGAPLEVIEYVVLHEVMHLKYFDHSTAFWEAIRQLMPQYKQYKYYLKQQQSALEI